MEISGKKLIKGYGVYVDEKMSWDEHSHTMFLGAFVEAWQAEDTVRKHYEANEYDPLNNRINYDSEKRILIVENIKNPKGEYTKIRIEEVGLII